MQRFAAAFALAALLAPLSGGGAAHSNDFAPCPEARRPARDAERAARLERELRALPDTPATLELRLQLLDRLAGLDEELDEYDFAPEPALAASLALREREGRTGERAYALSLHRSGVLQWARSRFEAAEQTLLRCRAAAERALGADSLERAHCQLWLGIVYNQTGRYAQSGQVLRDALAVRERRLGPRHPDTAEALFALGSVYISLGDYAQAEAHNLRALEIREAALGRCGRVVADSHNNLGFIYRESGRAEAAVAAHRRALAIRTAWLGAQDPLVAQSMSNLGLALSDLGRYGEAQQLLERSLEMRERALGPDHQRTAIGVWNLVQSLRGQQRLGEAGELLRRGLRGAFASGDPKLLWRFHDAYRVHHQQRGETEAAVFFGKQAVNTIQGLRGRLTELERGLQRSFVRDKSAVYRGLADLLIEHGRLAEAQQVLAMLKEEEYFDFIRRDAKAELRGTLPSFTAAEQPWARRYAQISGELATLGARREALERKRRAGLSAREQSELAQIEGDAEVARKGFVAFLDELVKESARLSAERLAQLARRDVEGLESHQDDLKELGAGAVMVHYVVMPDKVRIILTTADVQIGRAYAIEEKALNRGIHALREALQSPLRDARPAARALYEALLAPIAADLRAAGARTLMLSLDGSLRYVPFAALHDGERYVVESYGLALLTQAAKSRLTARGGASQRFAGLGTTRPLPGFEPLPAVKGELEGILKAGALEGEVYLDEAFTAERLRETLKGKVGLLHLASHFVFQPGTETDSFLLLGDGSRLSLRELREAGFNFRGVELLTLSACETALGGGADANGREVEGLGALAQQRGARAVMATLWPVADASTGLLMQQFYRLRAEDGAISKAEALRQAQLALLTGRIRHESGAPFAHPFFWAPFILMGNWL